MRLAVVIAMAAQDFYDCMRDAFIKSVSEAMGVETTQISVTCVCDTDCTIYPCVTAYSPAASSCGSGGTSAGRERALAATSLSDVQFSMSASSAREALLLAEFASSSKGAVALGGALASNGFGANAVVSLVQARDGDTSNNEGGLVADAASGPPPVAEQTNYSDILLTMLIGLPIAMFVVALAVFQNRSKKSNTVPLVKVILAAIFAFYDVFSDIWFIVAPVVSGFEIYQHASLGILVFCVLAGTATVLYSLYLHDLEHWGFMDYVNIVLCFTNLELLVLLPWANPKFKGLPDRPTAFLPSLSVIFEDLPQMSIQIVYLLESKDTGNIPVLVSVTIGCVSILARFSSGIMTYGKDDEEDDELSESEGEGSRDEDSDIEMHAARRGKNRVAPLPNRQQPKADEDVSSLVEDVEADVERMEAELNAKKAMASERLAERKKRKKAMATAATAATVTATLADTATALREEVLGF